MHQIRAHLASIGRGILGDEIYGSSTAIDCLSAALAWVQERRGPRMFLHCRGLRLLDLNGAPRAVESPLPQVLEDWLARLRGRKA